MDEKAMEKPTDTERTHGRILLVDDDQIILDSLSGFLEVEGYEVSVAPSVEQARNELDAGRFNLVITDVNMPAGSGFELLRHVRENYPETVVVMVTGYGTIETAVDAIKQGAYDYLTKPIIDDDVRMAVRRALDQQRLLAENRRLRAALTDKYSFENIVGQDHRMVKVFDLIEAVAPSTTNVLITGESGTGKSLVAKAIHTHSPRSAGPFVEVACGALPETLLESELFGHVRGAFTGAVADKEGKFAAADGGTIFLDEIATASPQLQVKLLRVLQERRFEPVGSNRTRQVDARVLLATNRDLWAEVQAGRFREDLYYRVNVVSIELPPLRDRAGDVPLLAEHFLRQLQQPGPRRIRGFTPEAMTFMQRYPWPGNVRELENAVERAVVLCREEWIGPDLLPPAVVAAADAGKDDLLSSDGAVTLREALEGPEKRIILAALRSNDGNRQATAEQLGINRTTLYKKMKKYGLDDDTLLL
ncbi:MAG: sigma-54-dependent transcriptional regulator [Phycisphaerae bacterium]